MILDILFFCSIILMLILMMVGTLKFIVLSALVTLVIMVFWLDKDKEYTYSKKYKNNSKTSKKKVDFEFSKPAKCFHTRKDCEECFSQSECNLKDENVL